MVDKVYCDLCGAEVRHVVTQEFNGVVKNFCCRGCLGVYELMLAEGLQPGEAEEKFFTAKGAKKDQ